MGRNYDSGMYSLQEFYNRGVIKLAPDVLVYIGGSLQTTVIAPVSGQTNTTSFNDGITSISVSNNVDPPGSSSATIEIFAPIYGDESKYWVTYPSDIGGQSVRVPIFVPMLEVKIYFKGRFLSDMKPRYYPAFWGFITNVEENYSGGMYKINISCADMLHWWAYSTLNVHPVPASNIMSGGGQTLTAFSTIFRRMNPFQILYKLTTNMGMHEFVTVAWPGQRTPLSSIYPRDLWKKQTAGIMSYWQQRFANMGGLLKMYGLSGKRVDINGVSVVQPDLSFPDTSSKSQTQKASQPKDDKKLTPDIDFIRKYQIFADYDNMGTFENAEYLTKLEIATEIKTRSDYEFYQDVDGNFIFKPPFYNLNVKGIQPYTFLPTDIISYSASVDIEGIITVLTVNGPFHQNLKNTSFGLSKGFHMDLELSKKYGIRHREITMEYLPRDASQIARTLALGQMSLINSKTQTGSVTVPGRPEIRLGYPIYLEHRDSFHYVKAINHSFDYGGSFTTTLSLETERRKRYDINGNLLLNKVYRLVEKNSKEEQKPTKANQPPQIFPTDVVEKKQQDMYMGEERIASMQQGRYDISTIASKTEIAATKTTTPFTDEDGYTVVGSFPYGRNVNALCVVSDRDDIPVLKEVYLTTMARPVYENESKAMEILFFNDKEGAVPRYLNDSENKQTVPLILGVQKDVDDNSTNILPTTDQKNSKAEQAKNTVTPGMTQTITNMSSGKQDQKSSDLVNKGK